MIFTEAELKYLEGQLLGRLATIGPDGGPQNKPVTFQFNPETQTIDIGGHNMGRSRKFKNVGTHPLVSLVVDDVSEHFRCIEIRGSAEALTGQAPLQPGFSEEIIRIRPSRVISANINPGVTGQVGRDIPTP
ncbi:PPOX class F420-dependent oxidoreductase [Microtetraspora sp. AC03309]|uniref:PPOX class F420-dependent oxidoreductase n=1 Tax=Microtetraspora sp. AC03309 TaxID=2779376 RepID=UPI001E343EF4|nr:PPOX class F420-dependent oxidoreductase [Microtetraspora sp. AC03309]MCC5576962.1 PPOX class F420-dependent oxidoreductase [Microtetraspora sp. AC03309]